MSETLASHLLLLVVGLLAGTLNVIAGGGSFLTLPVLILMGFPPTVANGTNRVGILLQNMGAVWRFKRYGVLDTKLILRAAPPACAGAVLGTWIALSIGDAAFQKTLALLMVLVTLWTLWDPMAKLSAHSSTSPPQTPPQTSMQLWKGAGGNRAGQPAALAGPFPLAAGFFAAGIYGGFVQAGVGFLVLAVTTLAGLDLVRGNALKVFSILCFTVLSLALFAWQGKVVWLTGLVLAAGMLAGGQIGAHLTVLKGHRWVKRFVSGAVLLFALKLWLAG